MNTLRASSVARLRGGAESFKRSPASRRRRKTESRLRMCSSNIRPSTITSSRYTRQCDHWRPARTRSMSRWKVAGALQSPNGMTLNWKRPSVVQKAVFGRSPSSIWTCLTGNVVQFPEVHAEAGRFVFFFNEDYRGGPRARRWLHHFLL